MLLFSLRAPFLAWRSEFRLVMFENDFIHAYQDGGEVKLQT